MKVTNLMFKSILILIPYYLQRLSHEAMLWGQLSHPNLLPFYGLYRFRNRLCFVAPWMQNGAISTYLESHSNDNRVFLV